MEGGVTKEHAGCMRDGELEGEGMTLSSRQAQVFTQSSHTHFGCVCVCVCACPDFYQFRETLTAGLSL